VAGATVLGRLSWLAAEAIETIAETPRTRTIVLDVPGWGGHRPGQHVDVRLTAEDGYQAQRTYSIASAPREGGLDLTVERIDDGEVSPYLVDDLRPGDAFELRGPIGGYFVWEAEQAGPLLLVAGGSGIVPLMSILRYRAAVGSDVPVRLLYSCRSLADVIYREELERLAADGMGLETTLTLTRVQPPGWEGYDRRIDAALVAEAAWAASEQPLALVCGPTTFVEVVAGALAGLGYPPAHIKTERFGPTGG
jgi:ferredoxin-NADP reductase